MSTIKPESALIYIMVMVAASDREMADAEMKRMGQLVQILPAFADYDDSMLVNDAQTCASLFESDDGVDTVLGLVAEAIPHSHRDLVYSVACDVAAADGHLSQEELKVLELIRHRLDVDRLTAAAIERGAAARRKSFPQD